MFKAVKSPLPNVIVQVITIDFEAAMMQTIPIVFHGVTIY